ncbi:MAG TPA: hypothetical protein VK789_34300 [Bryobacteraceae bacterium]|jgi:hypothetical protein|nr:hypothetical protein [Bryobacteraceae bacterium]
MKPLGILLLAACLLPGADGPHFDITDARGKKPAGVTVEAGEPDADGWFSLKIANRGKGDPVLVWPFDGWAKTPEGPEPIPVIIIQRGDEKALSNRHVVAAMAMPYALGLDSVWGIANKFVLDRFALERAIQGLAASTDSLERGMALVLATKHADAAEEFGRALKEKQNQLTRIPSEIFAAAILDGTELSRANKFDDAAVAFSFALKYRPSDKMARDARAGALIRAGKSEAAGR